MSRSYRHLQQRQVVDQLKKAAAVARQARLEAAKGMLRTRRRRRHQSK